MASLYRRARSPYWWIKRADTRPGKVIQESTGLRVGVGADTRAARELEATYTLTERRQAAGSHSTAAWDKWVKPFIADQAKGRTRERYETAWRMIRLYLVEKAIRNPRQLTYQHCSQYIPWRLNADSANGKYKCGRNTANLEFKVLRWLMREAVRQNYAAHNPAREVTIKNERRKLYLEFYPEHLQQLWTAIHNEPEPMRTRFKHAFMLARYHGVRLNETQINPSRDVKFFERDGQTLGTINFMQKGRRDRTKPLHPELIPLMRELQAQGASTMYPPLPHGWGNRWTKFLRRIGLVAGKEGQCYCFHGLRVTVENLLRRAGVPKELREEYLTHERTSEQDVNAAYDRFKCDELRACHEPLNATWL